DYDNRSLRLTRMTVLAGKEVLHFDRRIGVEYRPSERAILDKMPRRHGVGLRGWVGDAADLGSMEAANRVIVVEEAARFGIGFHDVEMEARDTEPARDREAKFGFAAAWLAGD